MYMCTLFGFCGDFSFLVFIFLGCQSVRDRTAQAGSPSFKMLLHLYKVLYMWRGRGGGDNIYMKHPGISLKTEMPHQKTQNILHRLSKVSCLIFFFFFFLPQKEVCGIQRCLTK